MVGFLELRGHYDDWEQIHRSALEFCVAASDAMGEATTRLGLAQYVLPFDLDPALAEANRAFDIFQELGCDAAAAEALVLRATVLRATGRHQEAQDCLETARETARQAGNHLAELRADREIAIIEYEQGRSAEATASMLRSLDRATRYGMAHEEATTLRHLAIIKREQGDCAEACELAEKALVLFRAHADRPSEAFTLLTLGLSALTVGRPEAAPITRSGLQLLRQLNIDFGEAQTLYVRARLDLAEDRAAAAVGHLRKALDLHQSSGSRHFRAHLHAWLGAALRAGGHGAEAVASYREALGIYQEIGNRSAIAELEQAVADLARIAR
jgi:tetratricopeptide (TPR) repeat protein